MRVLLVDDHPMYRRGLMTALSSVMPEGGYEVLEAGDTATALAFAGGPAVDLVLLDLHLPGCTPIETLQKTRAAFRPPSRVVVLTGDEDMKLAVDVLKITSDGLIMKSADEEELKGSLKAAMSGGVVIPRKVMEYLAVVATSARVPRPPPPAGDMDAHGLSPRQLEVARQVAAGKSNKEIARDMDLAIATVKVHLTGARGVLGARTRSELAALVARLGLTRSLH